MTILRFRIQTDTKNPILIDTCSLLSNQGKNGAGKTTTISVLTGILKPTSGQIYFYGHEFLKNFERSRKLLGYCPQYNVLFDRLTVREHLDFFARLKNLLPDKQIKADVENMLTATALSEVQNELAMNLSGGLQRRLCVAIAFIGGSKMIILGKFHIFFLN